MAYINITGLKLCVIRTEVLYAKTSEVVYQPDRMGKSFLPKDRIEALILKHSKLTNLCSLIVASLL